eukprot:150858_1
MSANPTETNWRPAVCRAWDPSPRGVDRCERTCCERRTWRRIPGCREIESLMLVDGLIFNQKAHHAAGGPTLIKNAKIGLIQFQLSATKSDVLEEAELSLHDALCVVRCLVKQRFLIPGGGAPEIEVAQRLAKFSETLGGLDSYCVKAFAEALEVIPYTLAENCGLSPIKIVTELRRAHAMGQTYAGINVRKGKITDIREENVLQPL